MTALTMAKAINAGLRRSLADDDRVVLMGEDIGTLGGVFRVTDGLQTEFGLEFEDLTAQGRLTYVAGRRRAAKMAMVGDRDHVFEVSKVHGV